MGLDLPSTVGLGVGRMEMIPLPPWYRWLGRIARPFCRALRSERLGPWSLADQPTIWLHAASLGEAKGILSLLRFLPPGTPLTLTATTRSGLERLASTGNPAFLLPLDERVSVGKFLERRRVSRAVFFEAEAWPCALQMLHERSIPTAFAAFRSSRASLRRWRRFSRLFPGWTRFATAVWTDSVTFVGAVERLGFSRVRPGTGLKWAGHEMAPQPVMSGAPLAAALSFHLRDIPTVIDLAQTHPTHGWLWFPRRPARRWLHRLCARIAGLRVVEGAPDRGEVRISETFGETTRWLPGTQWCWVSPGHDLEEPARYGVAEVWTGRPPRKTAKLGFASDQTAREIAHWLMDPTPSFRAYYNGTDQSPG